MLIFLFCAVNLYVQFKFANAVCYKTIVSKSDVMLSCAFQQPYKILQIINKIIATKTLRSVLCSYLRKIWSFRRVLSQFGIRIFIVYVVSNPDKLMVVVRTSDNDHCDANCILRRYSFCFRRISLKFKA